MTVCAVLQTVKKHFVTLMNLSISSVDYIMIIECRKGKKAFSRLIFQPLQKAKKCFLLLYHSGRNRQISFRNLLANQRFAVEILEFRLSIVVMS